MKLLKLSLLLLVVAFYNNVHAQTDCECPPPTDADVICVEVNWDGVTEIIAFPSACIAECEGLTVVQADCEWGDWEEEWPEDDCDCPDPEEGEWVCVEFEEDGEIYVEPFPSACYAECYGLTISDEECDHEEEEWPEDDCDCPDPEEGEWVCVEFEEDGEIYVEPFPSACYAECYGLTISDEECDYEEEEWPEDDCDCPDPEEEDAVCVLIEWDGEEEIIGFPSACYAECHGLTLVDGDCEWDDWEDCPWPGDDEEWPEDDCDCPDPEEGEWVCVEFEEDGETYIEAFPSACFAECYGLTISDEECDWEEEEWPEDDCDCPDPEEGEWVCVEFEEDGEIYVEPFPSACYAECYGLTISDEECDWEEEEWPEDDCDCPDPEEGEWVCVEFEEDGEIYIEAFPSACYAECYGLTISDEECDHEEEEWPEDDCDCPEPEEGEWVCVEFEEGGVLYIEAFPSACYAECYGLTISDQECDYEEEWPEDDCDCPEPEEGEWVCVEFEEDGEVFIEAFPSACYAECYGLTISDQECDYEEEEEEWEGFPEEWDIACFIENLENAVSFQGLLLDLHANCGLELSECILNAPLFDSDIAFIEYVETECNGWFGLTLESSSSSPEENPYLRLYQNYGGSMETTTNVKVLNELETIRIVKNPVRHILEVSTSNLAIRSMEIIDMNGAVITHASNVTNSVNQQIPVNDLTPGMYLLRIQGKNAVKSLKFIVVR